MVFEEFEQVSMGTGRECGDPSVSVSGDSGGWWQAENVGDKERHLRIQHKYFTVTTVFYLIY